MAAVIKMPTANLKKSTSLLFASVQTPDGAIFGSLRGQVFDAQKSGR